MIYIFKDEGKKWEFWECKLYELNMSHNISLFEFSINPEFKFFLPSFSRVEWEPLTTFQIQLFHRIQGPMEFQDIRWSVDFLSLVHVIFFIVLREEWASERGRETVNCSLKAWKLAVFRSVWKRLNAQRFADTIQYYYPSDWPISTINFDVLKN